MTQHIYFYGKKITVTEGGNEIRGNKEENNTNIFIERSFRIYNNVAIAVTSSHTCMQSGLQATTSTHTHTHTVQSGLHNCQIATILPKPHPIC